MSATPVSDNALDNSGSSCEIARLTYCSVATNETVQALTDANGFEELARFALERNTRLRTGGLLAYVGGIFFQVIEGPPEGVEEMYYSVTQDIYHHDIFIIEILQDVAERLYPDFTWHYVNIQSGPQEPIEIVNAVLRTLSTSHRILERYLPPTVLHQIQQGLHPFEAEPHKRKALVGFVGLHNQSGASWIADTTFAAFVFLLSEFYEHVTTSVLSSGGEVVKFVGPNILLMWPDTRVGPALHCCHNLIVVLQAMCDRSALPETKVGVGLCFGEVIEGNVGTKGKLDYTLLGHCVNAASRIKDATKAKGQALLLNSSVRRRMPNSWVALPCGATPLKGIREMELFTAHPKAQLLRARLIPGTNSSAKQRMLLPANDMRREQQTMSSSSCDLMGSALKRKPVLSVDAYLEEVSARVDRALESASYDVSGGSAPSSECDSQTDSQPSSQPSSLPSTPAGGILPVTPASTPTVVSTFLPLPSPTTPTSPATPTTPNAATLSAYHRRGRRTSHVNTAISPDSLIRVTYVSLATVPLSEGAWEELTKVCIRKNAVNKVTGFLLMSAGGELFMQILEGTAEVVEQLYSEIESDTRHDHVTRVGTERVSERSHSTYSCGTFAFDLSTGGAEGDMIIHMVRLVLDTMLTSYQALERYTQPKVLSLLKTGMNPLEFYSQPQIAAVLVSDIVNFSTISNGVYLDDVLELVNRFLEVTVGCVERAGGQVNKLIGDCVIAYFPALDPRRALELGLEIQRSLAAERDAAEPNSILRLLYSGVGIARGRVLMGNVGVTRLDFALIGEAYDAALAAETATRTCGHSVVMSASLADTLLNVPHSPVVVRQPPQPPQHPQPQPPQPDQQLPSSPPSPQPAQPISQPMSPTVTHVLPTPLITHSPASPESDDVNAFPQVKTPDSPHSPVRRRDTPNVPGHTPSSGASSPANTPRPVSAPPSQPFPPVIPQRSPRTPPGVSSQSGPTFANAAMVARARGLPDMMVPTDPAASWDTQSIFDFTTDFLSKYWPEVAGKKLQRSSASSSMSPTEQAALQHAAMSSSDQPASLLEATSLPGAEDSIIMMSESDSASSSSETSVLEGGLTWKRFPTLNLRRASRSSPALSESAKGMGSRPRLSIRQHPNTPSDPRWRAHQASGDAEGQALAAVLGEGTGPEDAGAPTQGRQKPKGYASEDGPLRPVKEERETSSEDSVDLNSLVDKVPLTRLFSGENVLAGVSKPSNPRAPITHTLNVPEVVRRPVSSPGVGPRGSPATPDMEAQREQAVMSKSEGAASFRAHVRSVEAEKKAKLQRSPRTPRRHVRESVRSMSGTFLRVGRKPQRTEGERKERTRERDRAELGQSDSGGKTPESTSSASDKGKKPALPESPSSEGGRASAEASSELSRGDLLAVPARLPKRVSPMLSRTAMDLRRTLWDSSPLSGRSNSPASDPLGRSSSRDESPSPSVSMQRHEALATITSFFQAVRPPRAPAFAGAPLSESHNSSLSSTNIPTVIPQVNVDPLVHSVDQRPRRRSGTWANTPEFLLGLTTGESVTVSHGARHHAPPHIDTFHIPSEAAAIELIATATASPTTAAVAAATTSPPQTKAHRVLSTASVGSDLDSPVVFGATPPRVLSSASPIPLPTSPFESPDAPAARTIASIRGAPAPAPASSGRPSSARATSPPGTTASPLYTIAEDGEAEAVEEASCEPGTAPATISADATPVIHGTDTVVSSHTPETRGSASAPPLATDGALAVSPVVRGRSAEDGSGNSTPDGPVAFTRSAPAATVVPADEASEVVDAKASESAVAAHRRQSAG